MNLRAAAWLAWSLCALSLTLTGVGLVLLAASRSHPNAQVFDYGAVLTVITISTSPVGALIASRRPQNPLGWIICTIGLGSGIEHFAGRYATYALLVSEPTPLLGGEVPIITPLRSRGITIDKDLSLVGAEGQLTAHPQHRISEDHLRYRREHYWSSG
jgi:hypothetical protein